MTADVSVARARTGDGLVRSVGLWRAVVHRSRADWPVVTAAFVLLVCAVGLLTTGALYGETVALGGLRQAVLAAPAADRAVVVRTSAAPAEVAALDQTVFDQVGGALSTVGGEVDLVVATDSLAPAGMDTTTAREHLTRLASYAQLDRHADLVAGRWAEPGRDPLEATLSDGAATALGLGVGGQVKLARGLDPSQVVTVTVVGVWRPRPDDGYFLASPLELQGVDDAGGVTTRGPFVVTADDMVSRPLATRLDLEWRGLPSIDGLGVDRIGPLGDAVTSLQPALRAAVPGPRSVTIATKLPAILADAKRSILVSQSGITLLTIQFAVLAGYAVLLVGGLLVDRRRSETALLRSRGASSVHLVELGFGEAVILAIPAVIVAPLIAIAVVRLLGAVGPLAGSGVAASAGLDPGLIGVAVLGGLIGIAVLTLPSVVSEGSPRGIRAALGRQVGRTMGQRLGIDLALVVLAAVALWQLRLYGAPLTRNARGVLGIDPLLVAAPAIGLLAGAVLATRLIPRIAEIGERVLGRRRGIVSPLGARQVARRPLRYTRSALLIVLATALGTFAAASAATWARSQVDQAAYRAAGDLRAVLSGYPSIPEWGSGSALRSIHGVAAATPVSTQSLDVGRTVRDGRLLAVDPSVVRTMVRFPAEAASTPGLLDQLAAGRPTGDGIPIDGRPRRLALTLNADLTIDASSSGGLTIPPDWQAITTAIEIQDGDGRLHRLETGTLGVAAKNGRIEVPVSGTVAGLPVSATYPLRLLSIELAIAPPTNMVMTGSVELVGVSASASDSGADWQPVGGVPGATGWTWTRQETQRTTPYRPRAGSPGRIEIGLGDETSPALFGSFDQPGATYRLTAPMVGDGIVDAIAGDRLLALTGAAPGDTISLSAGAQALTVRIIGSTPSFPPLDPATPFVVVDGATLDLVAYDASGFSVPTTEWWLSADDASAPTIATALAGPPYGVSQVVRRTALAAALADDPIWLGVVGALGLGAVAAVAFAAIGFLVGSAVSTTERIPELALLRALGLSGRQMSSWLSLEQVFLLVVGLVGGALLGLLLAWLVLPYSTLDPTGAAVVPTPVIVVPWAAILPIYLVSGLVMLVAAAVLARQVPERRVSAILRAGER